MKIKSCYNFHVLRQWQYLSVLFFLLISAIRIPMEAEQYSQCCSQQLVGILWNKTEVNNIYLCGQMSHFAHITTVLWLTHWGRDKWPPFQRRHFQMDFLEWKCINFDYIFTEIVPRVPINNFPALVQTMAWRRPAGKPLPEPMMVNLLTHICVTRPQWVKISDSFDTSEENYGRTRLSET